MTPDTPSRYLSDLPLWRLLVMLDDAERCDGPDSPTSFMLVSLIRERLAKSRAQVASQPLKPQGGAV